MATLWRIIALVRKELLAVLGDPKSRFSLIVPPILQCLIFGYAATYDLNHVPFAVLDQDRSGASRALIANVEGSGVFRRVATLDAAPQIAPVVDRQQALVVISIPRDFERDLEAGRVPVVQVIADGRNSNTAGIAQGYVGTILEGYMSDWRERRGLARPAIELTTRAWFNANLETRWNMIPSLIGTITMMMTMMLTAMSVAREREEGTFDQLLVTPYRPAEIMVGKALPAMLIGMCQATLILLVAQFWFQIPFAGSYGVLAVGLVLFVAASVGIGLFLSSLAGSMQQAMILSFVVLMPFQVLSGLTTSIGNMPEALQYLTLINPLRYAISIMHQVYLEGAGLAQLAPDLGALVALSAATLPVAAWMFRRRL